jgi:hypothetical protein
MVAITVEETSSGSTEKPKNLLGIVAQERSMMDGKATLLQTRQQQPFNTGCLLGQACCLTIEP